MVGVLYGASSGSPFKPKTRKMKKLLIAALFLLLLQGITCYDDREITIHNLSSKDIYFNKQHNYPDTTIREYNPSQDPRNHKVKSKEIGYVIAINTTWEYLFEDLEKLQIFIYDAEVIENTPWEVVRRDYLVLKRYDLTLQDIKDRQWRIEFTDRDTLWLR